MKAAVRREYGPPDVIRVEDVPRPEPRDDEILIRVRAASVNLGDWELLTGEPRYITTLAGLFAPRPLHDVVPARPARGRRPKYPILGADVAGTVASVGRSVTEWRAGDDVFGDCSIAGFGAFAEYVCVPRRAAVIRKPPGLGFAEAAAIPQAGGIAAQALGGRRPAGAGDRVLINGAGGGVGTFAVQLARLAGAEVTAVDGPDKLDRLRALGAGHAIDYTREDFTRSGRRYDRVIDVVATRGIADMRRALAPGGRYLVVGGSWRSLWQAVLLGPFVALAGQGAVSLHLMDLRSEDLSRLAALCEAGTLRPVIDGEYPLERTGDALRRLGEKRSFGKVIVTP